MDAEVLRIAYMIFTGVNVRISLLKRTVMPAVLAAESGEFQTTASITSRTLVKRGTPVSKANQTLL